MPVRRARDRDAHPDDREGRADLARLPPPHRARPALRLPRARALRPGQRPPLRPQQAAARPVREGLRRRDRLGAGVLLVRARRPGRAQHRGLGAARHEVGRDEPVLRLAGRPPAAPSVPRDRDLRGPRQGPHRAAPGHSRRDPRHLRRGRPPGAGRAPAGPRRDRDRADARAPVRAGLDARRQGALELLGLQHDRLLRPAQRLQLRRAARPAGARVQVDGARAAPRRHRGHPRRRLQPHRGGQPPRADAGVPRHRQRRLLPPDRRGQVVLLRHDRHRQHAYSCAARTCSS